MKKWNPNEVFDMRAPHDYACEHCGKMYRPYKRQITNGRGLFCCRECRIAYRAKVFVRPAGTKNQRMIANDLVNSDIKEGLKARPARCERCNRKCKPDAHHDDYSKPNEVKFLCRSCHMKAHFILKRLVTNGIAVVSGDKGEG